MLWPRSWAAAICSDGLQRWLAGRRSAEPLRRVGIQGSARVSRVGDRVLAIADFSVKIVLARRQNQHARRVRYPGKMGANFYKTSAATESATNLPARVRKTRLSFRASNPSLINSSA